MEERGTYLTVVLEKNETEKVVEMREKIVVCERER